MNYLLQLLEKPNSETTGYEELKISKYPQPAGFAEYHNFT
jgi:hypothetical protein